jgi:predicted transcriptional regulator
MIQLFAPSRQVRNELIAGLIQAGYRGKSIASYLRVSDATVSTIASKMRLAFLNPEKRSG